MATSHVMNLRIVLNDEEYTFLKNLGKRDGQTVREEAKTLFNLQLWEEMQLYEDEMKMEYGDE